MRKSAILFTAALGVLIGGCRSSNPTAAANDPENVKVTLNVNIEEAAPAPVAAPAAVAAPTAASQVPAARTKKASPVLPPQRQEASSSGIIDSELNSVERSYVQNVRNRNRKNARQSADQVFGSFKPANLVKGK